MVDSSAPKLATRSATTMSPQVVFFDFDGVIADTENIHVAAWQRTLAFLAEQPRQPSL